jgi:hypothetical protein
MGERSGPSGRLYVSETREYLVYRDACLRVRDRTTGRWMPVLPNRVVGAVPGDEDDAFLVSEVPPRVGERLCIQVSGRRVLSTPILSVEPVMLTAELERVPEAVVRPSPRGKRART